MSKKNYQLTYIDSRDVYKTIDVQATNIKDAKSQVKSLGHVIRVYYRGDLVWKEKNIVLDSGG